MLSVQQLEAEGKAAATKRLSLLLQRPDQLDKVDQHLRRFSRKKASVEAMLKTAMQSQLDGVRSGLNQLQTALNDLTEIKTNLNEIQDSLKPIPKLRQDLQDIREETMKHRQYAAAMENLRHIFTVPEAVEKTNTWINEGKLLHAHQSLSDLENSRDDLLHELHKLPSQSSTDKNMLKQYFADVEKLSDSLAKQLRLVLKRTLNTVRKEPTIIVTALRIIEREERADVFAVKRRHSGFLPPGRPKCWRQMAMQVLEEAVQERIEGNQFEERKDNKMWLVRHLEVTRQLVLEDLRVVKTLCVPCFPPEYYIFNKFVKMYHDCLSRHLQDMIASGLEGQEYVTLLTWVNVYTGHELLGHPDLNLDIHKLEPLLDEITIENLVSQYLHQMEQNFQGWMRKTLNKEIEDWQRETSPEADGEGYYHTVVPVIVFQMVDQNLVVARTISEQLVNKVMLLSILQLTQFGSLYRDSIVEFKTRYFEDRSRVKYFTHYMVAIVNNCLHFIELSHQMKNRYWKPGVHNDNVAKAFETMVNNFHNLRLEALSYLLDEAFLDLEPHFQELVTKKWFTSSVPIDTICCTMEDYCSDYRHLRVKNFDHIMGEALSRVCKAYIIAILQRKITFKNSDERKEGAEKIIKESELIRLLFVKLAAAVAKQSSNPTDILVNLAEVLKVRDPEILSLELSGLVRKYPDINQDHLIGILSLRGDVGRLDIRQLVTEVLPERKDSPSRPIQKSLFSEIHMPSGMLGLL